MQHPEVLQWPHVRPAPQRRLSQPDTWPWWAQMALTGLCGVLIAVAGAW